VFINKIVLQYFLQENFVTQIGGTDAKNFVKRIFQRPFSNELSSKCSWTGFRNNFKLENLTIVAIIKGVLLYMNFVNHNYYLNDF